MVAPAPAAAPAPVAAPVPEKKPSNHKRWYFGAFGSLTYNDFWDSRLGLGNMGDGSSDYTVWVAGQDNLLGNYWGFGVNGGVSAMYMFTEMLGLHLELGAAYRKGKGESDVTVILSWNDQKRLNERADLNIEYSLKQFNLDMPLFFRFTLPNILYVEAGPMASFNFYSRDKSVVEDEYWTFVYREEGTCDLFEFDAAFGLGTIRKIRSKYIEAGIRFVLGITRLSDADDAPKTWQGQFNLTFWFL